MQGILVHDAGLILELGIHRGDRSTEGSDELLHGPDGLDLAEGVPLLELVADVRHLDRDHLSELVLPELGDADLHPVSLYTHPQVVIGELEDVSHG